MLPEMPYVTISGLTVTLTFDIKMYYIHPCPEMHESMVRTEW